LHNEVAVAESDSLTALEVCLVVSAECWLSAAHVDYTERGSGIKL